MPQFTIASDFRPTGDQPQAIDLLATGVNDGVRNCDFYIVRKKRQCRKAAMVNV